VTRGSKWSITVVVSLSKNVDRSSLSMVSGTPTLCLNHACAPTRSLYENSYPCKNITELSFWSYNHKPALFAAVVCQTRPRQPCLVATAATFWIILVNIAKRIILQRQHRAPSAVDSAQGLVPERSWIQSRPFPDAHYVTALIPRLWRFEMKL
jgi:hypothetical protein